MARPYAIKMSHFYFMITLANKTESIVIIHFASCDGEKARLKHTTLPQICTVRNLNVKL